ncbi:MAG: hypothetical protein JWP67_3398 [Mucilaginibacter sp.]|nr:hypothetical protein [Mucilaginibacter sp.]
MRKNTTRISFILLALIHILFSCKSSNSSSAKYDSIENAAKKQINDASRTPEANDLYYAYKNRLQSKSLLIETYYEDGGNLHEISTGFLIEKKGMIYLVTNYHVIPAKNFSDTTQNENPYPTLPIYADVYFHGNSGHIIKKRYNISQLKIYKVPDYYKSILGKKTEKSVVDVVFIPIIIDDKRIKIDTINFSKTISSIDLSPRTLISIWGFSDDIADANKICSVDAGYTVQIVGENRGNYIFFNASSDTKGDSGSPVFAHLNNSYVFAGIHSFTQYDRNNSRYRGLSGLVSGSIIKEAANKLLP